MLAMFLPSPSDGHSDLVPNPLSAHHAPNATHRPTACPRGVLAVISRGLTLALQQVAVIHQCRYHPEEWCAAGPECVWARPLLSLRSIFQPLWRYSASLLFKISPSRSGSSATKIAHKLVLEAWCVWYLFGSGSEPLILMVPFYLRYLDHQRIAVWFQHNSKPDSWLLNWAAVLYSAFLYLPQVNRINSIFKQSIFALTSSHDSWDILPLQNIFSCLDNVKALVTLY